MYFMSSELTAPSTATLRRQLGKEGLFRLGVPRSLGGHGGTKEDVVRAVAVVAKRHPKSGVLLASQRLLIEVLLQAENIGVMEYQLPDLLDGHIGGNCASSWPNETAVSLADARFPTFAADAVPDALRSVPAIKPGSRPGTA